MSRRWVAACVAIAIAGGSAGCGDEDVPQGQAGPVSVVAKALEAPWGVAFLPDGAALVTERDSARVLRVTAAGKVTEVQRLSEVDASGEGGLLGIAVSPSYAADGWVYAYYTTNEDNRIVRFKLAGKPQALVTGIPVSGIHNGGRLAFGPDGLLYAGTGDASERGRAQDVDSLGGKILRMTLDGRPAPGNPYRGSLVYSLGHRNVQGLAWDNAGRLYATEFGQNDWDEVNQIRPGANYGWPEVEGKDGNDAYVDPLITWEPSQASPSGLAFHNGQFYVASLRGERLWRIRANAAGDLGKPEALLLREYGRLRHVTAAPDGSLWVLTSNRDGRGDPTTDDDRILRITP